MHQPNNDNLCRLALETVDMTDRQLAIAVIAAKAECDRVLSFTGRTEEQLAGVWRDPFERRDVLCRTMRARIANQVDRGVTGWIS
ncbi:MAG TPA: hypothetical protein VHE11_02805 [Steroidobacteraceae bacterium]|nr:hypothetical protein [Steroidobacteraceae bacterium]